MPEPTVETYLARIQTDPQGDSPVAVAFFGEKTTIGDKIFESSWTSVSWPLVSTETVTLGDGTVLTYSQASEAITLIAYKSKAEAAAAANPA